MQGDTEKKHIYNGKICPYCGNVTEYVDSNQVYSKSYGMIYLCRNCDAWVGVHKGTNEALGRLANSELREWKKQAHWNFDKLWKPLLEIGYSMSKARNFCYAWLAEQMQLPVEWTHIGMFDEVKCQKVVELTTELFEKGGALILVPDNESKKLIDKLPALPESTKHYDYLKQVRSDVEQLAKTHSLHLNYLSETQIRIFNTEKKIDIYPVHRKYHDVKKNERGQYRSLNGFLKSFFGIN